jgi:hypothetical protein
LLVLLNVFVLACELLVVRGLCSLLYAYRPLQDSVDYLLYPAHTFAEVVAACSVLNVDAGGLALFASHLVSAFLSSAAVPD